MVPVSFGSVPSWPGNPLWQALLFKLKAHGVIPGVSQVGEPISHAHYKQNGGIAAHRNTGGASFDLGERRSAYRCPLRGDLCANAPPPSCIPDILAELMHGTHNWKRQRLGELLFSHD
jgi:hypothetical protein